MDIVGRKVLLFIGLAGCCISLIIEAAIVATYATPIPENPNTAALKMGVAALYAFSSPLIPDTKTLTSVRFLFVLFYSVGIDVAGIVFYSEIWPNHLRSKGITLVISTLALTSLIYLEVAPTAFALAILPVFLHVFDQLTLPQNNWLEILFGVHCTRWHWMFVGALGYPGNKGYSPGRDGSALPGRGRRIQRRHPRRQQYSPACHPRP